MSGGLSRSEFANISQGTMSGLFIDRVFEEHVAARRGAARRDEMDLTAFVDFVLAWDHRSHPAALKYFFAIYDIQKQVRALAGRAKGGNFKRGRAGGLLWARASGGGRCPPPAAPTARFVA